MKNHLLNYFETLHKSNKIGHAFLICNTSLNEIKSEISEVISKYFFEEEIDIYNDEDITLIEPENNIIKTEKIKELQSKLKATSQIHGKKLYIISECEKMNDSASNKLLKLLEEPESNIYAILITSNLENVIKTIKSRCQILNFYNISGFKQRFLMYTDEEIENILNFMVLIEKEKLHTIAYYTDFVREYKEREKLRNLFNVLIMAYRDVLNIVMSKNLEYFDMRKELIDVSKNLNEENIVKRLIIINNELSLIDENLNVNLIFDRFIIEVMGD